MSLRFFLSAMADPMINVYRRQAYQQLAMYTPIQNLISIRSMKYGLITYYP